MPTLTYTADTLNGDTLSGALASGAGNAGSTITASAGTCGITQGTLANSNYTIT